MHINSLYTYSQTLAHTHTQPHAYANMLICTHSLHTHSYPQTHMHRFTLTCAHNHKHMFTHTTCPHTYTLSPPGLCALLGARDRGPAVESEDCFPTCRLFSSFTKIFPARRQEEWRTHTSIGTSNTLFWKKPPACPLTVRNGADGEGCLTFASANRNHIQILQFMENVCLHLGDSCALPTCRITSSLRFLVELL